MTIRKKQKLERDPLVINLFTFSTVSHLSPGSWAHPDDLTHTFDKISYWKTLSQLAERGKANIFVADILGPLDVYKGPRNIEASARTGTHFPLVDPSVFVSAGAASTNSVGFGITFSTISEAPYHLARRLATLDSASEGRIGWNVVTGYLDSAARNLLNGEVLPDHNERYERAEEYINVVYELLLSSWRDDAVVRDITRSTYADPERIREINFEGKHFKVTGPAVTQPTPQRLPVIIQAGASERGRVFAAKHAELIFINGTTPESLKEIVDSTRKIAKDKYGRNPKHLKFVVSVIAIVGKTTEEAEAKLKDYRQYFNEEGCFALFGGQSGVDLSLFRDDQDLRQLDEGNYMKTAIKKLLKDEPKAQTRRDIAQKFGVGFQNSKLFVGTAEEVADTIESWVDISGIDGFNFASVNFPRTHTDIVDFLIPELQRRGLAQKEYAVPGGTFRENLYRKKGQTFVTEDHPAYNLRWNKGSKEEFTKHINQYKKET